MSFLINPFAFAVAGGDFESIATVTVGSGGAANIEFTSIPGTYQHLQLRWITRTARANVTDSIYVQFNNDTTAANYVAYHFLSGDGSSTSAGFDNTVARAYLGNATAGTAGANIFAVGVTDILDYSSTSKNKVLRTLSGNDRNGSGAVQLFSSMRISLSAITSIKIVAENANFAQHTTAALYGVKAP